MPSPHRITSRQNPRVQEAVRLRTGRERKRRGRCLIDGSREIGRALAAGVRPVEAFVCEPLCDSAESRTALAALESAGAAIWAVTPEVFAKLAFGEREQAGIVLVAEVPTRQIADLRLPAEPLVAVVEGVEKPGNLGAILRSADAAGVDAVLVADGRTDLMNPNTIRASLGTVFRANVVACTAVEALAWLREQRIAVYAARPEAPMSYTAADFRGAVASSWEAKRRA